MALGDVIARLAVSLSLETAAFEKGATLAEKRMAQSQRKLEKIGNKMSDIGQTMSIGITAPLAAFGVSAFNAASDAAELQSSFDQTFGAMSATMNKWAEDTGNAMGRSTQEMQKAANTFGIFFNTAVDPAKAAEMSQTFAELAQDLGSFYNVDTQTAIEKLRSGLSGESEPLRDFGVFLTEANTKAKALEMGLTGIGNELTEQEKILARYQLVMEATTNAQGDVARTSEGTANQMRAARAAFEELQVTIGTKLLPVITPLIEKLGAAFEWFAQLPEPVQNVTLGLAAVSAAFGPVLIVVGNLLPLMVKLAPAIGLVAKSTLAFMLNPVILGFAAVLTGIFLAWKNWDKITAIVQRLYNGVKTWLQNKLGAVLDWLADKLGWAGDLFFKLYDRVVGHSYIPDMVDGIASEMKRLDAVMVSPIATATSKAEQSFRDMAGRVQGILDRLFPEVRRLLTFREELADIEGAGLSPDLESAARGRLLSELGGGAGIAAPDFSGVAPLGDLEGGLKRFEDFADRMAKKSKETTVRIAKSFKDMADETLGALQRMTDAIKGGGFLDILQGVFGFAMQLGSIGVFGSKIAANINRSVPAYAGGTNFHPGGLAIVGERGPELVSMPRGSRVTPNHELGGRTTINNYYGPGAQEFWGRIAAGDMQAASAGAQGGVARMRYANTRGV